MGTLARSRARAHMHHPGMLKKSQSDSEQMDSAQPVSGTLKNNLENTKRFCSIRLEFLSASVMKGFFFFSGKKLTSEDKQIQGERKTGL